MRIRVLKRRTCLLLFSCLLWLLHPVASHADSPVRYYADISYPPYSYHLHSTMEGFDVELLRLIFSTEDYQLEIYGAEWDVVLKALREGEADIISSLASTAERENYMLFTDTTAKTSTAFLGLADRPFSLDQLPAYENRVGVGQDYSDETLLREELGMEKYRTYKDLNLAIMALLAGQIDLIFAEEAAVKYFLIQQQLQGRVTAYETNLFPRQYHYGVSPDRPELVTFINKRLRNLRAAGVYETLYQKYFFEPSPYEVARQEREHLKTLAFAVAGAVLLFLMVRHLALRRKIQELQASNEQIRAMEQVLSDQVDQLQEHAKTIEYMAYHDDLTGLSNVRALREYLDKAMKTADETNTSISFMIMDLDDFQMVNDLYGHQVGDQLIQQLADRLKKLVPEDAIVVRPGGDEYILCSEKLGNRDVARDFFVQLLLHMQEPVGMEALTIHPCMSLGVAFYPEDAQDAQTLFAYADVAMYQAKLQGRNSYTFFTRETLHHVESRIRTEAELRRALENGEFELVYQPLVSAATEEFCATEALIRWQHPTKGTVPPMDFIPVAEATGQILAIGQWVLEEVCRQMNLWRQSGGKELPVSVNISLKQLQEPTFVSWVRQLLDSHGVSPGQLKLEITETLAMLEMDTVLRPLQALKEYGITISLDDFGTGFSSMNHLQNMPVHEVKIDKLKSFGCDLLQGYYYGMPMTFQELTSWAVSPSLPGNP